MKFIDYYLFHFLIQNTNVFGLRDNFIIPVTHISAYVTASKISDPSMRMTSMFTLFNTLNFLRMDMAVSAIHGFEKAKLLRYNISDPVLWTVAFAKRSKQPIYTLNQKSKSQYNKFKDIEVLVLDN